MSRISRYLAAAAVMAATIGSASTAISSEAPRTHPNTEAVQAQRQKFSRYSNSANGISFDYPAGAGLQEYPSSMYYQGRVETSLPGRGEKFGVSWEYMPEKVDLNSALKERTISGRGAIIRLKGNSFRDRRNREILYDVFDGGHIKGIVGVMHSAITSRLITFYLMKEGYDFLSTFERYINSFEENAVV